MRGATGELDGVFIWLVLRRRLLPLSTASGRMDNEKTLPLNNAGHRLGVAGAERGGRAAHEQHTPTSSWCTQLCRPQGKWPQLPMKPLKFTGHTTSSSQMGPAANGYNFALHQGCSNEPDPPPNAWICLPVEAPRLRQTAAASRSETRTVRV